MHTDTFSFEVENEGEVYKVEAKPRTNTHILGDDCPTWYKLLITGNGFGEWISFVPVDAKCTGYRFGDTHLTGIACIRALEQKISDKIISRNE